MARRSPLSPSFPNAPSLSPAPRAHSASFSRPPSTSAGRILKAVSVFGVVGLLAVGHVTLQFKTLDMKVQHRQLQEQSQSLQREEKRLEHQAHALADMSQLRDTAHSELQLRDADPRSCRTIVVSERLLARYAPTDADARAEAAVVAESTKRNRDRSIAGTIASFVDMGVATAASVPSAE